MSTSYPAAWTVLRALIEAQVALPKAWQFEENILPDDPAAFVYFEMTTDFASFIEIGGGRGANRYRHNAELHAFVFVPVGQGLQAALDAAEPVAAVFRSFRQSGVSCQGASIEPVGEGASLVPPGLRSAAGNYVCVVVNVPLYFDQLG